MKIGDMQVYEYVVYYTMNVKGYYVKHIWKFYQLDEALEKELITEQELSDSNITITKIEK